MGLLVAVSMLMAIGCGSTSGNNETSANGMSDEKRNHTLSE